MFYVHFLPNMNRSPHTRSQNNMQYIAAQHTNNTQNWKWSFSSEWTQAKRIKQNKLDFKGKLTKPYVKVNNKKDNS